MANLDQPDKASAVTSASDAESDVLKTHVSIPSTTGLTCGSRLGRYSIVEPLGAGGMGVVYRARDEKLERDVAIKVLSPGALTQDARKRFRKEALALARLSHSHIAAVYDVGDQAGTDYIVMECVPGCALSEKLRTDLLSIKQATSIVLQIAQALEEAHEQGIVHRDLKPANVIITPKGNAKVLDFGLAKLLSSPPVDATISLAETGGMIGTPLYMSPEQALGNAVDTRTDLWSLGVIYYEALTGTRPFQANSGIAILRAIADHEPRPIRDLRPELPPLAAQIILRALAKDPASRYQSAAEMSRDLSELLATFSSPAIVADQAPAHVSRTLVASLAFTLLLILALGAWCFHRVSQRNWAHSEAPAQINDLLAQRKALAAFELLNHAQDILPADPQLQQIATQNSITVGITSDPPGAIVALQDYSDPAAPWHKLGTTPIIGVAIPRGYFRWKLSKSGVPDLITAPMTRGDMAFAFDKAASAPAGMVYVPSERWTNYIDFIGWLGPFNLPAYDIDRFEVTNADFQHFIDGGGYQNQSLWPQPFELDGQTIPWAEAIAKFRDTTGRTGPSTWAGGHFPEGEGDDPVTGISWFEASAYAASVGKSLPVLAQFFQSAPPDVAAYTLPLSNFSSTTLAPVGKYAGLGAFGTYDMFGNAREWVANPVNNGTRYILGGSWKSPVYSSFDPSALSPFDRSATNGFRCVRNLAALPEAASATINHVSRDFANFKPVSDEVFRAYKVLYNYAQTPLNARSGGIVGETADWREEKVTYDTAYRGERMSAYLFLPKNVSAPYQTVIFFPSARVSYITESKNGLGLGDLAFVDYVIQSGRAVMYPIYENTYERQVKFSLPGGGQNVEITTDWYKDTARSLDYLATRPDIDSTKLAYLGVSMGSAEGVISTELLQDRLKTAIFLDGGYFLETPPPGGDQAEFALRMKKPVLMVNGRYDFAFSVELAQNPLFNMLATPAADKQHILLETSHDVTDQRPQLVNAVLTWLDKYLGRVGQ